MVDFAYLDKNADTNYGMPELAHYGARHERLAGMSCLTNSKFNLLFKFATERTTTVYVCGVSAH